MRMGRDEGSRGDAILRASTGRPGSHAGTIVLNWECTVCDLGHVKGTEWSSWDILFVSASSGDWRRRYDKDDMGEDEFVVSTTGIS